MTPRLAGAGCRRNGDDQGVALSTTTAERRDAGAAVTSPQLHSEGEQQPSARGTDRMAESDGSTVHVHLLVGLFLTQTESASAGNAHRSEGLVNLDQFQIGDADLLLLHSKIDGMCRLQLQRGVWASNARVRANLRDWRKSQSGSRFLARYDHCGRAI